MNVLWSVPEGIFFSMSVDAQGWSTEAVETIQPRPTRNCARDHGKGPSERSFQAVRGTKNCKSGARARERTLKNNQNIQIRRALRRLGAQILRAREDLQKEEIN